MMSSNSNYLMFLVNYYAELAPSIDKHRRVVHVAIGIWYFVLICTRTQDGRIDRACGPGLPHCTAAPSVAGARG